MVRRNIQGFAGSTIKLGGKHGTKLISTGRKSTKVIATQALAVARQANKKELKYHQVQAGATLMQSAGVVFLSQITSLDAGTGINQRIGNAVEPTSLIFRLSTLYNPLAASGNQLYRIIVYQSLLTGTAPSVLDYLNTANFYSFKSIDNRFNSVTLMDKTYRVSNDNPQNNHNFKIKIPKNIYYPSASSTPEKNACTVIVISNEPVGLASPFIEGQARFYYKDM